MVKLADIVSRFILMVCKLCLLVQIAVVMVVVVGRYVFSRTPGWGEGLALFCMVWFGLLSGALAVRGDQHISVDFIDRLLPQRASRILDGVRQLVSTVFGLCLIVGGYRLAYMTRNSVITGLGIKTSWVSASVAVCGALIILMALTNLVILVLGEKTGKENGQCRTPIWRS